MLNLLTQNISSNGSLSGRNEEYDSFELGDGEENGLLFISKFELILLIN